MWVIRTFSPRFCPDGSFVPFFPAIPSRIPGESSDGVPLPGPTKPGGRRSWPAWPARKTVRVGLVARATANRRFDPGTERRPARSATVRMMSSWAKASLHAKQAPGRSPRFAAIPIRRGNFADLAGETGSGPILARFFPSGLRHFIIRLFFVHVAA